ncbi:FhuF 2Fe-2S C-terminal domain-containing protein [Paenibacillus algorifonticola]|uniref:FhuF 2Fe-2S C-terminal domain-containing protein n=1 Tax=Paenibacillus algorifonticola TaxID=684063 RepID=A0A1I2HPF9_9BACL|nr:IucA/IucC family C-terminal-domain containing protein [Paenibacillus algorifonticola]SFF30231.1 FhuF 2Fe-2S C-terminal domain-containing protein [Paenibacillus algorifonticola]
MTEDLYRLLKERFNLCVDEPDEVVYTSAASALLEQSVMQELLAVYQPFVNGTEQIVAEVYAASWFRRPMLALIYMLAKYRIAPDLSLDNLTLYVCRADGYYNVYFKLNKAELLHSPSTKKEAGEWVRARLEMFFHETIAPFFHSIERAGSAKASLLWGQLPTSLEYEYGVLMASSESEAVKEAVDSLYKTMKALDPAIFYRKRNPLDVKFQYTEAIDDPEKQMRIKYACCHYYKVEGGRYCYTCPRISDTERVQRRSEHRAKLK